ncbi:hypothetical protein V5O48_009695 [Marasmius crinis-equi]|uniref:Uncharacterized protein n=1 Tax=Marasmius crinis-equi TaxID=585013 RepID=A0ABR3FAH1_9AGAR
MDSNRDLTNHGVCKRPVGLFKFLYEAYEALQDPPKPKAHHLCFTSIDMPRNTAVTKLAINKAGILPRRRRFPSKYIPIPRDQRERARLERAGKYEGAQLMLDAWRKSSMKTAVKIARAAGKKLRWSYDMMFNAGARFTRIHRKTNSWNAFRHVLAKRLNDNLEPGEEPTTLQEISRDYRDVYHALSASEIKEYVKEYEEDKKDHAARVPRPSIRSKAQDAANVVENMAQMLTGLKERCGTEGFFNVVRSTPDNFMEPQWFFTNDKIAPYLRLATKGGWDTGKVGARLQAFAVAGCETSNLFKKSHDKAKAMKGEIRDLVKEKLGTTLDRENPKMHYEDFDYHISYKKGVVMEGWPLPQFKNPSELSSALGPLEQLRDALVNDTCRFRKMDCVEWAAFKEEYLKRAADAPKRKQRKDAGLPRPRKSTSAPDVEDEEDVSLSKRRNEDRASSSEDDVEIEVPTKEKSKKARKEKEKEKEKERKEREKREKKKADKKKKKTPLQPLQKSIQDEPAPDDADDHNDSDQENVPLASLPAKLSQPRPQPRPVNTAVRRGANSHDDNDDDDELLNAFPPAAPSNIISQLPPHLQMLPPVEMDLPTDCLKHEATWRLALDHADDKITFPQLEMGWMTALGRDYNDAALAVVRNAIFAAETDDALCRKNILELKHRYLPDENQAASRKRARADDTEDGEQLGGGKRARKPRVEVHLGADHHPNSRDPATIKRKAKKNVD